MVVRRSVWRAIGVLILALTPWILLAIGVHAQVPPNLPPPGAYQPIPNFAGVGAGLQFRQAINDRFSGIQPIAPAIVIVAFANLPTEQDGALIYCTNCTKTIPCAGGGSGAWAMGQTGQWTCRTAAFSPTSDTNFNAHKTTNLASGTVNGDALAFGQVGSQLGAYLQRSVVSVVSASIGSGSVTANKPLGTMPSQLLVFGVGVSSSSLVVTPPVSPGTWTLVRANSDADSSQAIYQRVAGNSEPSNYTSTLSAGPFGEAAIVAIANQSPTAPIDGSSITSSGSASSITIAAPTITSPRDLNLASLTNGGVPHVLTAPTGGKLIVDQTMGPEFGGFHYTSPTTSATVTGSTSFQDWTAAQVAISPATVVGAPPIRDAPMGFSASTATNTPNYSSATSPLTGYSDDGMFNVVSYGADPTGVRDNSAAFAAAYIAACAANNPPVGSVGAVYIPNGTYNFLAPWLAYCPNKFATAQTPDIVGAGKTATVLLNNIGVGGTGGGPLLELDSPIAVSSLGGSAGLITAGLTASGGNSFDWDGTPAPLLFNLDQMLGDQALNGKSQLDIRVIFNTTTNSATEYLVSSDGSAQPLHGFNCSVHADLYFTCGGAAAIWLGSDGKLRARINTSVTGVTLSNSLVSPSAVGTGTNLMAELSYDGSFVRLYHGALGGTLTEDAKVAQTGTIVQRADENLTLGSNVSYWNMLGPFNFWQGKMDSVQISSVARCTNDSGCSVPKAKLTFDSNTLFGENWSNVSNLPLVEPEYVNGVATDQKTKQAWMSIYNEGLGSSAGNYPTIRDFSIRGGMVGIHVNVVSPRFERIDMTFGPLYGILDDIVSDYDSSVDDCQLSDGVLPIAIAGGLRTLSRLSLTCGVACLETASYGVRDSLMLVPSATLWGIIINGPSHIDNLEFDTENGGLFTGIQLSNMNLNIAPSLELDSSRVSVWGAGKAPITIDGIYGEVSIKNSSLAHQPTITGPMVDVSKGTVQVGGTVGIDFENNTYDGHPEPSGTAGDSYTSATDINGVPVNYAVIGGSSTLQTTLTGTSAGTFIWSMPGEGSSYKRFVGHYTGYNNTTATAQTIKYPVAFSLPPKITSNDGPSGSSSTTALTLPASMSGPVTGWIILEGY